MNTESGREDDDAQNPKQRWIGESERRWTSYHSLPTQNPNPRSASDPYSEPGSFGGDSEETSDAEMVKSDEELARMLQAEEDAMMFQQFVAARDNGGFEGRVRPYVSQVLMYEDPVRQEAARKTVPKDELEEKALVSLAKLLISNDGEDETEVVKETYETNQRSEEFGKVRIDLSEKEALLKEIAELKSKLQPTKSTDNMRSSLLLRSFQMRKSTDFTKNTENNSEALEKEPERWRVMESEWIFLTDDLRMDIDNHRRHAKDLEIELKKVKMATEELNDALGRAMFGHSSSKNKLNELDANPSLTEFQLITH